jgi:hypothetical protein
MLCLWWSSSLYLYLLKCVPTAHPFAIFCLDSGLQNPFLCPLPDFRVTLPCIEGGELWNWEEDSLLIMSTFWWALIDKVWETKHDTTTLCHTPGWYMFLGTHTNKTERSTEGQCLKLSSCCSLEEGRSQSDQFTLLLIKVMRRLKTKNFDWEQNTSSWSRWITKQQRSCFYTNILSTKTKEGKPREGGDV